MEKTFVTSEGQERQVVDVFGHAFIRHLEKTLRDDKGKYHLQRILAQGNILIKHMDAEMKKMMIELSEQRIGYLHLISNEEIIIKATKGERTIEKMRNVFRFVDHDLAKQDIDVKGLPTPEMRVEVFKMIKNGTAAEVFGGFGENLDRLCLTQDQIISFVENHTKWIGKKICGVSFLTKIKNVYFVFEVDWFGWHQHKLRINIRPLSCERNLYTELNNQFVIPKL